MSNYTEYQYSIANELLSIKDRVKSFIDDRHMGEDGRYKEIILMHTLRKHLPQSLSVGTGFVRNGNDITRQVDVIVYRNDIPLMFKQDDFIIAPAECVLAIIEVKTNLRRGQIRSVLEHSTFNGKIIGRQIFNGVFAFDTDIVNWKKDTIIESLKSSGGVVNHICCGANNFIKFWNNNILSDYPQKNYGVYKIDKLSFGYFISNLVEDSYLTLHGRGLSDTLNNMFYPIEETKEAYRIETITVEET